MTSNIVSSSKRTDDQGPAAVAGAGRRGGDGGRGQACDLKVTSPNGLLKLFTKNVLETALNEEVTDHLGHAKNQAEEGRGSTNVRNGNRSKTVVSDAAGEVRIDVPRVREGTFEPQ